MLGEEQREEVPRDGFGCEYAESLPGRWFCWCCARDTRQGGSWDGAGPCGVLGSGLGASPRPVNPPPPSPPLAVASLPAGLLPGP